MYGPNQAILDRFFARLAVLSADEATAIDRAFTEAQADPTWRTAASDSYSAAYRERRDLIRVAQADASAHLARLAATMPTRCIETGKTGCSHPACSRSTALKHFSMALDYAVAALVTVGRLNPAAVERLARPFQIGLGEAIV